MRVLPIGPSALLALLVVGGGCSRNNESENQVGAARDSTAAAATDQTQSGVTDSSGQSTLGPGVEQTRPDQGQPVTSKGDTIGTGTDSPPAGAARDSSAGAATDQTQSGVTDSSGQSTLGPGVEQTRPDQGKPVTSKGDTISASPDSSTAR